MALGGAEPEQTLERYILHDLIGSGGMARVYVGRQRGLAGFSRAVAIKRLHPDLASDPALSATLLDEACVTANVRHPNVVATLDVVQDGGEFLLVMEYVIGVPLDILLRRCFGARRALPDGVVSAVMLNILGGLHAAHETTDERGEPLEVVHRDMSPQNVIVDENGIAKVLDFGIAKARSRLTATTEDGNVKGKPAYVAPEQLARTTVDRRADVYAAGVMLWEMLVGQRLRAGVSFAEALREMEERRAPPHPRELASSPAAEALGDVAMRAMSYTPGERYPTARAMALAIEAAVPAGSASAVSTWCDAVAHDVLEQRRSIARARVVPEESGSNTKLASAATLSTKVEGPTRTRRWARPLIAGALGLSTLAAISALAWRVTGLREVDSTRAAGSGPVATLAPPAPEEAPASASAPPVSSPPAPTSSGAAASATRAPRLASSPRAVTTASKPAVRHPTTDPCRVPFEIDVNGMKIPKRECL